MRGFNGTENVMRVGTVALLIVLGLVIYALASRGEAAPAAPSPAPVPPPPSPTRAPALPNPRDVAAPAVRPGASSFSLGSFSSVDVSTSTFAAVDREEPTSVIERATSPSVARSVPSVRPVAAPLTTDLDKRLALVVLETTVATLGQVLTHATFDAGRENVVGTLAQPGIVDWAYAVRQQGQGGTRGQGVVYAPSQETLNWATGVRDGTIRPPDRAKLLSLYEAGRSLMGPLAEGAPPPGALVKQALAETLPEDPRLWTLELVESAAQLAWGRGLGQDRETFDSEAVRQTNALLAEKRAAAAATIATKAADRVRQAENVAASLADPGQTTDGAPTRSESARAELVKRLLETSVPPPPSLATWKLEQKYSDTLPPLDSERAKVWAGLQLARRKGTSDLDRLYTIVGSVYGHGPNDVRRFYDLFTQEELSRATLLRVWGEHAEDRAHAAQGALELAQTFQLVGAGLQAIPLVGQVVGGGALVVGEIVAAGWAPGAVGELAAQGSAAGAAALNSGITVAEANVGLFWGQAAALAAEASIPDLPEEARASEGIRAAGLGVQAATAGLSSSVGPVAAAAAAGAAKVAQEGARQAAQGTTDPVALGFVVADAAFSVASAGVSRGVSEALSVARNLASTARASLAAFERGDEASALGGAAASGINTAANVAKVA